MIWLATALTVPTSAAVLIESTVGGQPIRLISDDGTKRVLIDAGTSARLVDLDAQTIFYLYADRRPEMIYLGDFAVTDPALSGFSVEKIGPGPRIAGYATTRFQIILGAEVCSVIHANLSLQLQLDAATRAVDLLDRVNAVVAGDTRSPCERIPYRRYRRIGWGLQVEDQNAPVIQTTRVDVGYQAAKGELDLPSDPIDLTEQFWRGVNRGPE